MEKRGYQAKEALELTGLTYRQLDHWVRTEVITPGHMVPAGDRTIREFSIEDLVTIRAAVKLLGFGLSLSSVKKATNWLQEAFRSGTFGEFLFVADKDDFTLLTSDPALIAQIIQSARGQIAITIDIGEIANQLRDDIEIWEKEKTKGGGRRKYAVPNIAVTA